MIDSMNNKRVHIYLKLRAMVSAVCIFLIDLLYVNSIINVNVHVFLMLKCNSFNLASSHIERHPGMWLIHSSNRIIPFEIYNRTMSHV